MKSVAQCIAAPKTAGTTAANDRNLASPVTVIAIGNPLLSDDGVGIHVLEQLGSERYAPINARLLDGGTFGPELLAQICSCRKLLFLDAIDVGAAPGSLVRIELDGSPVAHSPKTSMHDLGIYELLDDLRLLGEAPDEVVMLGVQPAKIQLGTDLSCEVDAAIPALAEAAARQILEWNADLRGNECCNFPGISSRVLPSGPRRGRETGELSAAADGISLCSSESRNE